MQPLAVLARWSADRADAARDRRAWGEAARAYRLHLLAEPQDDDRRIQYGHVLKELGRLGPAVAAYRRVLARRPDSADLHLHLGHIEKLQGRPVEARQAYARALELDPDSADARQELAVANDKALVWARDRADSASEDGRWSEAGGLYRLCLEISPDDGALWEQLGLVQDSAGEGDAALAAFEQARRLAPERAVAGARLARALMAAGRLDEAAEAFADQLTRRPDDQDSFHQLVELGQRERAQAILLRAETPGRVKPGPRAKAKLAIFTIASNNYTPAASVLIEGARRHYPEADLFVCLGDRHTDPDLPLPDAELLLAHEVGVPGFENFAFRYGPTEFHTALKPFVFRYLFAQRGYEAVIYFDPDILIEARSDGVMAKLAAGASFVVTPHLRTAMAARAHPDTRAILSAGVFNLGFLAARACAESAAFIGWWAERLQYDCRSEPERGLFVDQKFMDLLPIFAPAVQIERSLGANIAYWNLSEGRLSRAGDSYAFDGVPLEFFHFSGFDPRRPTVLSKHLVDAAFPARSALSALLRRYSALLFEAGYERAIASPLTYEFTADGVAIAPLLRRLFRDSYPGWRGRPFHSFEQRALLPDLILDGRVQGPAIAGYLFDLAKRKPVLEGGPSARAEAFARWLRAAPADNAADRDLIDRAAALISPAA